MSGAWPAVKRTVEERTERVLAALHERWDGAERRAGFAFGPRHYHPERPPGSVAAQLDRFAGIASTVVFYTSDHRETVLVYNRGGWWEPPGGVIEGEATPEETAVTEAREETGLTVELTGLCYTRPVTLRYASGHEVTLPLAQFVGHRTGGTLSVEREGRTHPGTTRAVGLFDAETLPDLRRDRDLVTDLLGEPPEWSPGDDTDA